MLNVDPTKEKDLFYRYKMPALVWKVEGQGNGIKTVVVNMQDIAVSLNRPAEYIMKSLSTDLGVGVIKDNGRWLLRGDHVQGDKDKLQKRVFDFIIGGVLCNCRNPETFFFVELGMLKMSCKACSKISDTTLNEKVTKAILKNEAELQAEQDNVQNEDETNYALWSKELPVNGGAGSMKDEEIPTSQLHKADVAEADTTTETSKIHIRVQQRNGRQCITTVQGLGEEIDHHKLLKSLTKSFGCNGKIVPDAKLGTILQLQGDQRMNIGKFLVDNGVDSHEIETHGF